MYWRQVVSQSPTTADADQAVIDHYLSVWEPLNQRILTGSSFSGNERNCFFLNTGQSSVGKDKFADVSAASSLNHIDDSRTIAVTDWDQDGDLDLWITNRTSPRIRFLRNDTPTKNGFVAFKLDGLPSANCPRDAYGAKVEVAFKNQAGQLTKRTQTLHGGDSFLSQSSKWLHFGVQPGESIQSVSVRWPGSKEPESFSATSAGKRWLLAQTSGVAKEVKLRTNAEPPLAPSNFAGVPVKATGRLKISWPQSVGDLEYRSMSGGLVTKKAASERPTLYMCWASWCAPCLKELKEVSQTDLGDVDVIALNIEEATSGDSPTIEKQLNILKKVGFNGTPGIATLSLLGTLNQKHLDAIYLRTDLPLPVSFLVDKNGLLRVVYKGPLSVAQVVQDLQTLDLKGRNSMSQSVPFPGRWSEEFLDGNPIAVARVYTQDGSPKDAETFLKYYLEISKPTEDTTAATKVDPQIVRTRAAVWYELAMLAFRNGQSEEGYSYCKESLTLAPKSASTLLAIISHLANKGKFDEADPYCDSIKQIAGSNPSVQFQLGRIEMGKENFPSAIELFDSAFNGNSRMFAAANNLAWILATNKDDAIRDGARAVEVAKRACEATEYKDYRFFSTLAAAYAEAGDFEGAIDISQKAIEMATAKGDKQTVASMNERLKLFESRKPVRD